MSDSKISKLGLVLLLCCMGQSAIGQHFDIEGDSKIKGKLDIADKMDITSIYVGTNTGINTNTGVPNYNTFIGTSAGQTNVVGNENSFFGSYAGFLNVQGYNNSFFGSLAGLTNVGGSWNAFFGSGAGSSNTEGDWNTFFGHRSGYSNNQGDGNAFFGHLTGESNTIGDGNTFIGSETGKNNTTGNFNIAIGSGANFTANNFTNAIVIGTLAQVNASNKVRIGNGNISVIEGQVPWSSPSDRRLKKNITYTQELGLDFIQKLRPARYSYASDKNHLMHDGFIAQDVVQILDAMELPFSGISRGEDGLYSLSYSSFVIPLISAVQELSKENENLKMDLAEIEREVAALKELMNQQ